MFKGWDPDESFGSQWNGKIEFNWVTLIELKFAQVTEEGGQHMLASMEAKGQRICYTESFPILLNVISAIKKEFTSADGKRIKHINFFFEYLSSIHSNFLLPFCHMVTAVNMRDPNWRLSPQSANIFKRGISFIVSLSPNQATLKVFKSFISAILLYSFVLSKFNWRRLPKELKSIHIFANIKKYLTCYFSCLIQRSHSQLCKPALSAVENN